MFSLYNINSHLNFILKMENTSKQLQNSSNLLNLVYNLPYLGGYNLPFILPHPYQNKVGYHQTQVHLNKVLPESSFNQEYKSRTKENIILNSNPSKMIKKPKVTKINDSEEQATKVPRKCIQKETRNINSNLLRIFLKNLIELRVYTGKIKVISRQICVGFTTDQFYFWIQGFAINFKNYIRSAQVKKIISFQQPAFFRKTFLILLHHYSREIGLMHCLTSKRIEKNSIKMHLKGLRSLAKELQNASLGKR